MPMPSIKDAIKNLYDTFANVPRPHLIEGCPCCIDRKEVDKLLSQPLRDIAPKEMAPFATSAMLTVGSAEDLRYFLPRILEIRTSDRSWWPDVEVIFSALAEAKWHDWSEEEQRAIRRLVRAVIENCRESGDDDSAWEADAWLCAVSRAGESAVPYLEQMFANGHIELIRQLHELNAHSLMKGKLTNSFWSAPSRRDVIAWFERADIKAAIADAYRDHYDSLD